MIVPENEELKVYDRQSMPPQWIEICQIILNWPADHGTTYMHCPMSRGFEFVKTPQGSGYWWDLTAKAQKQGIHFVLPDEARAYIKWLINPVKDNEETNR